MDKLKVHSLLSKEVMLRIELLQSMLDDAMDTTTGETKSSAGDKHETSRAMAQIEQDKIGRQLFEMQKLMEIVHRIDPCKSADIIRSGSLIQTSNGWFYISVGIGLLPVEKESVFCMAPLAPLGKLFLGKKVGDIIEWQGQKIDILKNI